MQVNLVNVGKKFGRNWIFRHIDFTINGQDSLAITGPNGSGKSTLLKIIGNYMDPSEGTLGYENGSGTVPEERIPLSTSFVAPYLNLIEELTLEEHIAFHFTFKRTDQDTTAIAEAAGLSHAMKKPVGDFSSGMKQRLKLALATFSDDDLLLLDEPTTNLDEDGIGWYHQIIQTLSGKKTIIIASNQRYEFEFTKNSLDLASSIS